VPSSVNSVWISVTSVTQIRARFLSARPRSVNWMVALGALTCRSAVSGPAVPLPPVPCHLSPACRAIAPVERRRAPCLPRHSSQSDGGSPVTCPLSLSLSLSRYALIVSIKRNLNCEPKRLILISLETNRFPVSFSDHEDRTPHRI
jgi:hypothetical protein